MSNKTLLGGEFYEANGTDILDKDTSRAIEVSNLADVVDNTLTSTGSSVVHHRIENPLQSVDEIHAKQEALRELRSNDALRTGVEDLLVRVKEIEEDTGDFLQHSGFGFGPFSSDPRWYQKNARKLMANLSKWSGELPEPESDYLKTLKTNLDCLEGSPIQKLAKGPLFRSLFGRRVYGLRELTESPKLASPLPFHTSYAKATTTAPLGVAPMAGFFYSGVKYPELMKELMSNDVPALLGISGAAALSMIGGWIGSKIGKARDLRNFMGPMRDRFNKEGRNAFETIGRLDELLAYDRFGQQVQRATIPDVSDDSQHKFYAEGLINIVQSQEIPDYVPNEVDLGNGQRLTFLTGPNSGGKTSLGKAIAQAQDLAQVGCYVPADVARMSVADKIHYLVGKNDNLANSEGGLGTQFGETKGIMFGSTPKSLVIVDDLIEGTTFDEKTEHTRDQLSGFVHKRPNTVYISHHYELAQTFADQGVGNFLQVEFDGDRPTHRIIPGISTNSHSDVVAKRVGFDSDAIMRHLIEQGYIEEGADLRDLSRYADN
jgi:DNA mismatch repair protein MutS